MINNGCVKIIMEIPLLPLVSRVGMALSQGTEAVHSWNFASNLASRMTPSLFAW